MDFANFYKLYFNFTYFLCVSPFRFTFSNNNNIPKSEAVLLEKSGTVFFTHRKWKSSSFLPQKVICALSSSLGIYWMAKSVIFAVPLGDIIEETKSSIPNPRRYFSFAVQLTEFIIGTTTLHKFWFQQDLFLDIIHFVDSPSFRKNFLPSNPPKSQLLQFLTSQLTRFFVFSLITFVVCLRFIAEFNLSNEKLRLEENWSRFLADQNDPNHIRFLNIRFSSSIFYLFISVLELLACLSRATFNFCALLLPMSTLTLWAPAKSFAEGFEIDKLKKEWSWLEFNEQLKQLRELADLIAKAVGTMVTLYLVEVVLLYGLAFNVTFLYQSGSAGSPWIFLVVKIVYSVYFVGNCVFLLMSADICSQVNRKTQVNKNYFINVIFNLELENYFSEIVLLDANCEQVLVRSRNHQWDPG